MEKAFEIQKAARENVQTLKSYLTDLDNWEIEMKRKEAALLGKTEQELPPIRSKLKKEKPVAQVTREKKPRIAGSDYNSWDKFDVDAACEEVETADIGPTSLDSKRSEADKMEKLREEAQYEKERGNALVKQSKWDEAIKCYSRAIELYKNDAIFYANRGLCYLKMEKLHQAESDCTAALNLDPTYVKAYQRRACALEKLGSLRSAANDLGKILELEPNNVAVKKQLQDIKTRMGTKGSKSKSSPISTPISSPVPEMKPFPDSPKIVELEEPELKAVSTKIYSEQQKKSQVDRWKDGSQDGVKIVQPVNKPPHLRSKKPLKAIPIEEIELGKTEPKKQPKRIQITEIENGGHGDMLQPDNKDNKKPSEAMNKASGDTVKETKENKDSRDNSAKLKEIKLKTNSFDVKVNKCTNNSKENDVTIDPTSKMNDQAVELKDTNRKSLESEKLSSDMLTKEGNNNLVNFDRMVAPVNSVQFMMEWKSFKSNVNARIAYLHNIDPSKLAAIFLNAMESDTLSSILHTMAAQPTMFTDRPVASYLKGLAGVRRFTALAMFLEQKDKDVVKDLLKYCKETEGCSENDINELRTKYEI